MKFNDAFNDLMVLEEGSPEGRPPWGLTQSLFSGWLLGKGSPDQRVSVVARELASDFAFEEYWSVMKCADLPDGLDFSLFQAGYNVGQGTAVRILQHVLGDTADGAMGPVTIEIATKSLHMEVIREFLVRQNHWYDKIANARDQMDEDGWHNRVSRTASMIGITLTKPEGT